MVKKLTISVAAVFTVLLLCGQSRSEIYRYTDGQGVVHYVNDMSRIPEKYQGQLKDDKPLPQISVIPASRPMRRDNGPYIDSSADKKIEIFVTSWCPYCKKLLAALDARGVAYTKYDIEADQDARAVYKSLGGAGVPVTRVGSSIIRGNNPEAIIRLLR